MNCKDKHPRCIEGYNGLYPLVRRISEGRVGRIGGFLESLASDLERQSHGDAGRNRIKLASNLYLASNSLFEASSTVGDIEPWSDDLPFRLGNLQYDVLVEFLDGLAGRLERGCRFVKASGHIRDTSVYLMRAWKICEPYMK